MKSIKYEVILYLRKSGRLYNFYSLDLAMDFIYGYCYKNDKSEFKSGIRRIEINKVNVNNKKNIMILYPKRIHN